MKGLEFKTITATFLFSWIILTPSFAFANNTTGDQQNATELKAKLGCMACHQRNASHTTTKSKKMTRDAASP